MRLSDSCCFCEFILDDEIERERQSSLNKVLKDFHILMKNITPFFLINETLYGIYFNKKFMKNQKDISVGILDTDYNENIRQFLEASTSFSLLYTLDEAGNSFEETYIHNSTQYTITIYKFYTNQEYALFISNNKPRRTAKKIKKFEFSKHIFNGIEYNIPKNISHCPCT